MRPLLLSLLFAASMLHAAASSMTVSMESKGVPKAEFRSGTNAVLTAAKASANSAITSATNVLASASYNWSGRIQFYCEEYPGNAISSCNHDSVTIGSSKSPVSQLTCALVGYDDTLYCIEIINEGTTTPLPKLSTSPIYRGSIFEFNITCTGLSSVSPRTFVVRVTYSRRRTRQFDPYDATNVSCVRTFYITAYFAASPAL